MRGVVGFEQSVGPADLARVARTLDGWLRYPNDADLGLAFRDWMAASVERMALDPVELGGTLTEATMTLAERMAEWPKRWRSEGEAEGVARQRAVLRRQSARRFGDPVGGELDAMLRDIDDWDLLSAVADLIVSAESAVEFKGRVVALLRRSD